MVIDAALEEWEQRVQRVYIEDSRSPLTSATRHTTECSAYAVATSEDYCAVSVARWLWAELSITGWRASCA